MWITSEIIVKTAQNFYIRTKNSLKWMILESKQRNKEKGSPIKLHIEFCFPLCTSHNLHCNFLKFCSIVTHRAFKPKLLVTLVSFNSPLATMWLPIFSPAILYATTFVQMQSTCKRQPAFWWRWKEKDCPSLLLRSLWVLFDVQMLSMIEIQYWQISLFPFVFNFLNKTLNNTLQIYQYLQIIYDRERIWPHVTKLHFIQKVLSFHFTAVKFPLLLRIKKSPLRLK